MLKTLSLCQNCGLQFDVSSIQAGSKFRCDCGAVVEVKPLKLHNSAVIHCSGCGGAKKNPDGTCSYCSSQFTLHEMDLNGSCPQCLTKTSSKAAYCHGCGLMLTEGLPVGKPTKQLCPSCQLPDYPMSTRVFPRHSISLLECNTCAGVWVSQRTFDHLCKSTFKKTFSILSLKSQKLAPLIQPKRFYRICPVCNEVLNRVHYQKNSGVVVDVCRQDGIWFDIQELETVLNYEFDRASASRSTRIPGVKTSAEVTKPSSSAGSGGASGNHVHDDREIYEIEEDIDLEALVKSFFSE